MVNEHRDSEANLRRRKWKLETEVENWIHKYDSDMGERQTDFEEVDSVYTEERKQLVELEERFKVRRTEGMLGNQRYVAEIQNYHPSSKNDVVSPSQTTSVTFIPFSN